METKIINEQLEDKQQIVNIPYLKYLNYNTLLILYFLNCRLLINI